ncbi:MAG TPA: hypothetical protein VJ912_03960 [Candidatus Nanoarchaeia archaeon]|nr:hypothetical protein [Candidatus Nanoarchaeia archaeon]
MKLLGFNYTKIEIEKLKEISKDLKINSNIDITDIKEVKQSVLKSKETILSLNFSYKINYNPDYAKVNIGGNFILSLDPKTAKDILKEWKNNKIPKEFKIPLFNIILKKANVKALSLEEDLNLPLHLPMPKVGRQKKPSKEESNSKK